jgi:multiple antibiotic resistance protein
MMPLALAGLAKYALLVVGTLFPIVNPIGNTPIFLSLTSGLSGRARRVLARMIALNGLILILAAGGAGGRRVAGDLHGLDAASATE